MSILRFVYVYSMEMLVARETACRFAWGRTKDGACRKMHKIKGAEQKH